MDVQIKKGILEMCVLFVISQNEMYGYDMMKMMKQYFPEVDESTFYSILRRLNKDNICESYLGEESNGPKRKYYRITKEGKVYLENSINDWRKINEITHAIGIK